MTSPIGYAVLMTMCWACQAFSLDTDTVIPPPGARAPGGAAGPQFQFLYDIKPSTYLRTHRQPPTTASATKQSKGGACGKGESERGKGLGVWLGSLLAATRAASRSPRLEYAPSTRPRAPSSADVRIGHRRHARAE
eukprot:scaffold9350_cov105-Isochrysis_galbana.AAC.2